MTSDLLTISRVSTARACQRKHKIKYIDGIVPVSEASALKFGSLSHDSLEAWWLAFAMGADPMYAVSKALEVKKLAQLNPFDLVKVFELMRGYTARWIDQELDVIAVEKEFRTELINPETGKASRTWRLGGKIDVIVQDRKTKLIHNIEHKTTSENITPGSEYWRRLRMDGQISIYFDGARALGYDVASCIYDVISKPGIRPLQVNTRRAVAESPIEFAARLRENIAEDPDGYFQRAEVVRIGSELEEARWDIWQLGKQLRESDLAGRHPRNPGACVMYGSTCPYLDVCSGVASLQDETLFKKIENVHPELAVNPKEGSHDNATSTLEAAASPSQPHDAELPSKGEAREAD